MFTIRNGTAGRLACIGRHRQCEFGTIDLPQLTDMALTKPTETIRAPRCVTIRGAGTLGGHSE